MAEGLKCIICHAPEKRGYIIHLPTCPMWEGKSQHVGGYAAADAAARYRLLVSRLSPNPKHRDRYTCPSCGDQRHGGLKVDQGSLGPVFYCFGCCTSGDREERRRAMTEILAAVGLTWSDILGTGDDRGGDGDQEDKKQQSVATTLVNIALERYRLGVSESGETFAVPKKGPMVVQLLRGGKTSLRGELSREYFRRAGRAASQQALADALGTLDGFAQEQEPERLWQRVAQHDGALWLDLGDNTGRAVRITPNGWSVVDRPPVLFRRTPLTAALPVPEPGGDIKELWEWLNVSEEDRPLVLAELVHRFWPDQPHVVVGLFGEQGTGKSTAARVLVTLTDPSPVPLRKPPKDAESWVTAAAGSWVVALDNLSHMPDWLSDSICRASTGDGDVRRKLYTDGELVTFAFRRCVLLTGIDLGALNGDLAERMLPMVLDTIPEQQRRDEEEIWPAWEDAHPRLLGALLDLVARVMGVLDTVQLDSRPRMADYARRLYAVDQILGTDGFSRYTGAQARMAEEALTGDPFITAIRECLRGTTFTGTAAELLAKVQPQDEKWRPPRGWPSNPRVATQRLRRQAPVMRKAGWQISEDGGANKAKSARWTITPPVAQDEKVADSDPPDPPDPPSAGQGPFSAGDPLTRRNPPGGSQAGQGGSQAGQGGSQAPAAEKASDQRKAGQAGQAGHDPGPSPGTPCCETTETSATTATTATTETIGDAVETCPDCGVPVGERSDRCQLISLHEGHSPW